jgi:hypothetical protein
MITLQLLFCFNTNTNKYEACEHIFDTGTGGGFTFTQMFGGM